MQEVDQRGVGSAASKISSCMALRLRDMLSDRKWHCCYLWASWLVLSFTMK
jgi:hypothetical protein